MSEVEAGGESGEVVNLRQTRREPETVSGLLQDMLGGNKPSDDDGGAELDKNRATDGGEAGGVDPANDGPPTTVDELAERAGITVDELFAIGIPMRDGREPATLGEIKDQALEGARLDEQRKGLSLERENFERETIQARTELAQVVALLGDNVPPELLQQAQAKAIEAAQYNHDQLVAVKPEWGNPDTFTRAKEDILKAAEPYGFTRADLENVQDYRLTLLLDHFAKMSAREAAADALAKQVGDDPQPRRSSRAESNAEKKRKNEAQQRLEQTAKETQDPSAQRSAVSGLLMGSMRKR